MDSEGLAGMFKSYAQQMQEALQQQRPAGPSPGANVMVKGVGFHPPGAEDPLLQDVSFHLKPNQLGLIIGRSGSGKTTLLQLLAGLTEQTSGDVFIHRPAAGDHTSGLFLPTHIEQRMQQVGGHAIAPAINT
jgi:ABC-type multidrug transport system fused ATPase/permease subunit